jgi:hypothetical protein
MGINYSDVTVAVPFVRVEASQNPNLRSDESGDSATAYFRAMVVAFASIRRLHPDICLKLISNAPPPAEFGEGLNSLGVEVDIVAFNHEPPKGFTQRFAASLYLLDALAHADANTTIFIDPDVLCVNPLDGMLEEVGTFAGAIWMKNYTPKHDINGLTRQQAGELHELLGEPPEPAPKHFGGEVYVFPKEQLARVLSRSEEAWALALARHNEGLSKFTTEEHILSYAFRSADTRAINSYAARVWTARSHRTVDGTEKSLALWHLPAEKDRGFAAAYSAYNEGKWPDDPSAFMDWAAREMGVYNRTPKRIAIDTIGQLVGRARKIFAAART